MLKLVVAATLVCIAVPAGAVTVYTTQAAFDAAVTGETTFGFNEGNSAQHYHVAPNPYGQSGITFTDNTTAADTANNGVPILFLIGNAATPNYGVDFLSFQNTQVGMSGDITSSGVTALGFNYSSYIVDGAATVSVNGGAPIDIVVTGNPSFIGFTSATPITDLNIVFPGAYSFDLTSVSYAGGVPEPAGWGLMLAGIGLAGAALRRRTARIVA